MNRINKNKASREWKIRNPEKCKILAKKRQKKLTKRMYNLKINGCAICGYDKYDGALDFHHSNPKDKKFNCNIESLRLNNEDLANELNKCILLCCRYHREIEG